jgi:hypothetical protein
MNPLLPELGVHIIMNTPEPFGQILLITFYRVVFHVFGKALTAVFTGEDVRERLHKFTNLGRRLRAETYQMK